MYTFQEIIIKGGTHVITEYAKFRKECLSCYTGDRTYSSKHYGLYGMFTVPTQWVYATPEELLFILGATMILDEAESDHINIDDVKCANKATIDTIENMKLISSMYNVDIKCSNYDDIYNEMDKSGKFIISNYYYFYRLGRYICYQLIEKLKANNLLAVADDTNILGMK